MLPRHALLVTPLIAAALIAGCGGSSSNKPVVKLPAVNAKPAQTGGGLTVSATDARLGDATVAIPSGTRQLPVHRIVDAQALRQAAKHRQGVGAGASCQNVDVMPDATNLATVVDATLCLLNGERADAGLVPLTVNNELGQAAEGHSQDMVTNQYFDHVTPDGRDVVDRIRATGYIPDDRRWTVGENLAWGTGDLATPRSIVTAWMNSQGHRENILRPEFREIGFGVVAGNPRTTDGGGATYTTNFGAVSGGGTTTSASVSEPTSRSAAVPVAAATPAALKVASRRARTARRHAITLQARSLRRARARARAARRH